MTSNGNTQTETRTILLLSVGTTNNKTNHPKSKRHEQKPKYNNNGVNYIMVAILPIIFIFYFITGIAKNNK